MASTMSWDEAIRRIRDGEPVADVLDEKLARDELSFRDWMAKECPDQLASYDARMRDIKLGITGARNAWHSISPAQRRALTEAAAYGGRLERIGKEYRHKDRHQPYRPIYVATVRAVCAHEFMAWDGGAFDPEGAAVVTERGHFVLKHGRTDIDA